MFHQPAHHWTAKVKDGFLVATVDTSRGYFSITGSIYPSEDAYRLGNDDSVFACGCLHEEIGQNIPELRDFIEMHLSDVETGEPMHAESNARYRLDPAGDFANEMRYRARGSRNYYAIPADASEDEIAEYIVKLAASSLRCATFELPDSLGLEFDTFMETMREHWETEAAHFRRFLSSHEVTTIPADEDSETFAHDFGNGLTVYAECVGDEPSTLCPGESNYKYAVTITYNGDEHVAEFHGSVADFWDGRKDARSAAFGSLREIGDFHRLGEEMFDMLEWDDDDPRRDESEKLADRFGDAIDANMDTIGI